MEQESYAYPPLECVDKCLQALKKMGKELRGELPTLKQKKAARRIVRAAAAKKYEAAEASGSTAYSRAR